MSGITKRLVLVTVILLVTLPTHESLPMASYSNCSPSPTAHAAALKSIASIEQEKRQQAKRSAIKLDDAEIKREARRQYVGNLTLDAFFTSLTPTSHQWLTKFFDNRRKPGEDDFSTFRSKYGSLPLSEIRRIVRAQRPRVKPSRVAQPVPHAITACPDDMAAPDTRDIKDAGDATASMLIRKDIYACQQRYLISTPNQAIFLRGRNQQSSSPYCPESSPYFPDYCNTSLLRNNLTR